MISLGDLDRDGRGDFAAGSPFENGGRGAVRIFFGKDDLETIQGEQKSLCRAKFPEVVVTSLWSAV